MSKMNFRWGRTLRVIILTFLITLFAAPLSNVAWVDERGAETRSLLGSYLAGRFARSLRDNSEAAKFYEKVLTKDPDNNLILERAFLLEAIAGNWDRATRLAEDVTANEASHQIARVLLGIREFKRGNYKAAEKHFSSTRKGTLSDLTVRLARAWTFLADGNPDGAFKVLNKMKKADWSRFYQQYHKGLIADVAGKRKIAMAALSQAFKSRPRTLRIAEAYARHASNSGNNALAKKILKKHIGKSAGHPISLALRDDINAGKKASLLINDPSEGLAEVFYAIGDALTGENSTEVGLVYLRIALYLKPEFPLANLAVGEVYDKMEKYEQAIGSYDRVRKTSPIWKNVQIRKAYDLNSLDRVDEAKALLENLAKSMQGNPRAYDALGSIMRARQRYKESEQFYSRAIEIVKKPQRRHWTLYYARGVSRERLKKWVLAEADLKMALKLHPDQPLVLNYLGYSWVDQGQNLKQAMNLIRKAVKLKPADGYFVDSLGWAHYRLGNYELAAKHLERAVELRSDDPVINDHLGDAYWRVGRFLEAKYQWSQALTLEPEVDDEARIKEKIATGLRIEDETKAVAGQTGSPKKTGN
ncbi:MAG: tetratricopeptide repeat protein [Alphaproteobacteria bacterium]